MKDIGDVCCHSNKFPAKSKKRKKKTTLKIHICLDQQYIGSKAQTKHRKSNPDLSTKEIFGQLENIRVHIVTQKEKQ